MDEKEQIRRRIAAGNFVANNGRVLRTINILRYDYKKLREIEYALPDMEHGEIVDSVNYLAECGYLGTMLYTYERLKNTTYAELAGKVMGKYD